MKVSDCSGMEQGRTEQADGWRFLGTFNHPGRDCGPPGTDIRNCNTNMHVRSDDGVSVSHEADPTPDRRFMFVTDERGGGVVPPGSSCAPGIENPFGNGGAHAFDISDPSNITYATTPTGEKSVYVSDAVVPAETFCDIHVIEQIDGEQRFIAADDIHRGIDVVSWTGPPNPRGAKAPPAESTTARMNAGLAGASVLVLALATAYRRRRLR